MPKRTNWLARCFPGAADGWLTRVLANLDWLGYVTIFNGPDGRPDAVGLTDKGEPRATRRDDGGGLISP